jgi:transcriptional regulator with PAS, ATPase and Fis domain
LRERVDDIALLVNAFFNELRSNSPKNITGVSPEVMERFVMYDWPGNIRELKSALEYAFLVAESGMVEIRHLPTHLQATAKTLRAPDRIDDHGAYAAEPEEKLRLIEALRQTGGNQSRAASILGVHRMTVFNRMRKYGIQLKGNL